MATLKNLKTNTETCKRIKKDLDLYEKEVEREAAKTADMKAKGADPYDLKQQENVLAESRMMIPNTRQRLDKALNDLNGILAQLKKSGEKMEGSEFDDARSVVGSLKQFCQPSGVELVTSVVNDGCS
ncbi:hypothetical protein OROGR_028292 [Orobanche gracilis]